MLDYTVVMAVRVCKEKVFHLRRTELQVSKNVRLLYLRNISERNKSYTKP